MKFIKGTQVWLVQNSDSAGTVSMRKCVVDSWGKVQVHLRQLNGVMTHRRFHTHYLNVDSNCLASPFIFPADGSVDVNAQALALAALCIARRTQHLELCLTTSTDPHYLAVIRADLKTIHEPRVIDRTQE